MKQGKITEYSMTPQARYDRANTTFIGLRLDEEFDADIIAALSEKPKQTEVKRLVRLALGRIRHNSIIKK